jgi:hypothetical protein
MAGGWRARQWLGRPTGTLMAALLPQPAAMSLVAVRSQPLRVVVVAAAGLAHGDVRGTRIRLVGAVAQSLAELRRRAALPAGTPLVGLLDAVPEPGAVPGRTAATVGQIPRIVRSERLAFEATAREAGFAPYGVLSKPDAVSRGPATPPVVWPRALRPARSASELLVTAAVAALRRELRAVQPETDDTADTAPWGVEALAGAPW